MRCVTFLFSSKAFKTIVYLTGTEHVSLDWPQVTCSVATGNQLVAVLSDSADVR